MIRHDAPRRTPNGFRLAKVALALVLAPLCAAWNGSADGVVERDGRAGRTDRLAAQVIGTVDDRDGLHTLVTVALPEGGDGVLSLTAGWGAIGAGWMSLPVADVRVRYIEYGPDGEIRFEAARDPAGRGHVDELRSGMDVAFSLSLTDVNDPERHRRLRSVEWLMEPVRPDDLDDPGPLVTGSGGGVVVVPPSDSGGCSDSGWDDAEGDDGWSSDDGGWDSSDSGGCDGDDWDSGGGSSTSSSSGSSSGCEGDDLGSSSGADSGGGCDCEGDAIAAAPGAACAARSPVIMRLVSWLPWLVVFAFVRLARRRRRWPWARRAPAEAR